MQQTRKDFPGIKEMREAARAMIHEWGWPDHYYRDEMPHKACRNVPQGHWKIMGIGNYQGADWVWRRYVSYRCPKCGTMIQVSQPFDMESDAVGELSVFEVLP